MDTGYLGVLVTCRGEKALEWTAGPHVETRLYWLCHEIHIMGWDMPYESMLQCNSSQQLVPSSVVSLF